MFLKKYQIVCYIKPDGIKQYGVIVSNNKCLEHSSTFQVCPYIKNENTHYYLIPSKLQIIEKCQIITVIGDIMPHLKHIIDKGILEHHKAEPNANFNKGDIWFCNIPKQEGSIQFGVRPILISSAEIVDDMVTIIPLTTKMKKKKQPTHVLLQKEETGLYEDSMLLAE